MTSIRRVLLNKQQSLSAYFCNKNPNIGLNLTNIPKMKLNVKVED